METTIQKTIYTEAIENVLSVLMMNFILEPRDKVDLKKNIKAFEECLAKYGVESHLQVVKLGGTK